MSPMITALGLVSWRGAKRFLVEIFKTGAVERERSLPKVWPALSDAGVPGVCGVSAPE